MMLLRVGRAVEVEQTFREDLTRLPENGRHCADSSWRCARKQSCCERFFGLTRIETFSRSGRSRIVDGESRPGVPTQTLLKRK